MKKIGLLGGATGLGQKLHGPQLAPQFLRENGLCKAIQPHHGLVIKDYGDIQFDSHQSGLQSKASFYKKLRKSCEQVLEENDFSLFLGGDHSIAVSTVSAVLDKNPDTLVIWIDAHADINTLETSPTGNFHGMPLSVLTGMVMKNSKRTKLDPKNLIYLGLRDVDSGEKDIIKENEIIYYCPKDLQENKIEKILEKVFKKYPRCPIHISFDVDAIDPLFMQATGVPVQKGLTLEQTQKILQVLARCQRVHSMDLVEFNPDIGKESEVTENLNSLLKLFNYFFSERFPKTEKRPRNEKPSPRSTPIKTF